jgi:NitT/TauT family transport system substrate-binding protein
MSLIGNEKTVIRVGHFLNVTHAQGVIGHALTRQGKGWFEERLGPHIEVQWFIYNAGPTSMEAIFTDSIDLSYVGPNPAINAFLKSEGQEVRIVCGSCSGGAALVVQSDERIKTDEDFKGKKIATPQFGNTQDIAARSWLKSLGYRVTLTGGDVLVIPTPNPDQLSLFKSKSLDAVWTIEPWVSQLIEEAQGKIYFRESELWPETKGKYVTTHLVSSTAFLEKKPDLLKKWIAAHVELTDWIQQHPIEAKELFIEELKITTKVALPQSVLDQSWKHIELTYDPIQASLFKMAKQAHELGFLKQEPNLKGIYELTWLNEILRQKNLPEIP